MMANPEFTDRVRLRLRASLDDNEDMGLNFAQTCGFLFAMLCSPEMIPPGHWIEAVVGKHAFDDEDQARQFFSDLMSLYDWIGQRSQAGEVPLPDGVALRTEPLANFEPGAPFRAWSEGFCTGHGWTEESWSEYGPDDEDLGLALMSLGFFSSRRFAEAVSEDMFEGDLNLERIASTVCKLMPEAFEVYAAAGRAGQQALAQSGSDQSDSDSPGSKPPGPRLH